MICIFVFAFFVSFLTKEELFTFYLNLSYPRVTQHWPEFGEQEGKELITVADAMRHEGGMPQFSQQLDIEDRCKVKTAAQ